MTLKDKLIVISDVLEGFGPQDLKTYKEWIAEVIDYMEDRDNQIERTGDNNV